MIRQSRSPRLFLERAGLIHPGRGPLPRLSTRALEERFPGAAPPRPWPAGPHDATDRGLLAPWPPAGGVREA
jgi:hypothetical protein